MNQTCEARNICHVPLFTADNSTFLLIVIPL